jgi:hypothetical protein
MVWDHDQNDTGARTDGDDLNQSQSVDKHKGIPNGRSQTDADEAGKTIVTNLIDGPPVILTSDASVPVVWVQTW